VIYLCKATSLAKCNFRVKLITFRQTDKQTNKQTNNQSIKRLDNILSLADVTIWNVARFFCDTSARTQRNWRISTSQTSNVALTFGDFL